MLIRFMAQKSHITNITMMYANRLKTCAYSYKVVLRNKNKESERQWH